jgi:hypothetical protein
VLAQVHQSPHGPAQRPRVHSQRAAGQTSTVRPRRGGSHGARSHSCEQLVDDVRGSCGAVGDQHAHCMPNGRLKHREQKLEVEYRLIAVAGALCLPKHPDNRPAQPLVTQNSRHASVSARAKIPTADLGVEQQTTCEEVCVIPRPAPPLAHKPREHGSHQMPQTASDEQPLARREQRPSGHPREFATQSGVRMISHRPLALNHNRLYNQHLQ